MVIVTTNPPHFSAVFNIMEIVHMDKVKVWRNSFNEIVIQQGSWSVSILPSELNTLIKLLQDEIK